MNKVEELEKKWFRYKLKKLSFPFLALSAVSIVVTSGYYFYDSKKDSLSSFILNERITNVLGVSVDANESKNEVNMKLEPKKIIEQPLEEIIEIPKVKVLEEVALRLTIPVIDMEKEERISDVKRVRSKRVKSHSSSLVYAKKNNYLTPKELRAVIKSEQKIVNVPRKTKKMYFKSSSINYMEMLKLKFSKSKNSREALLLAKAYYKQSKYSKSEAWALSANKLDNKLEDSWLIFAKSKVKLNKKREALNILVSYYKKSHSIKAKRLIGQIKTGKI